MRKITIPVPTVGTITVKPYAGRFEAPYGMGRDFHRVTFEWLGCSYPHREDVGQPAWPINAPFNLYDTVHAAMSFMDAIEELESDGFMAIMEIPVGHVEVTRHRFHVVDDGNGGSMATDGTHRHKTIKIRRGYGESPLDAVMRHVTEWEPWEGAGTFDSIHDPERWTTVPVCEEPDRIGIPCVAHTLRFADGELMTWLGDMAREAKRAGIAW